MHFGTFLIGAAALVGAGYLLGKKVLGGNEEHHHHCHGGGHARYHGQQGQTGENDFCDVDDIMDTDSIDDSDPPEKESYKDIIKKASLFTVGAVKTSADKLAEGFKEIAKEDMVLRGERTVDAVKSGAATIKNDLGNLANGLKEDIKEELNNIKGSVSNIGEDTGDTAKQAADVIVDSVKTDDAEDTNSNDN